MRTFPYAGRARALLKHPGGAENDDGHPLEWEVDLQGKVLGIPYLSMGHELKEDMRKSL